MDEPAPDEHLEGAFEDRISGDAPDAPSLAELFPDDETDDDADETEADADEADLACAAWLLRLEDDAEAQAFAQADQFDEGWRR